MAKQIIDLDHQVRLTLTYQHPSLDDQIDSAHEICETEQPLDSISFTELDYLTHVLANVPDDIKDEFPDWVVERTKAKVAKARYARVTLLMGPSILESIDNPQDVFEWNAEADKSMEECKTIDAPEIEDDAVPYNPFEDEEEVSEEILKDEAMIVGYALEAHKVSMTRKARGIAYDAMATKKQQARTEEDLLRIRLKAIQEKEDARWIARLELRIASNVSLAFTKQERVFLQASADAYDHLRMRVDLAKDLFCTTPEEVALEDASKFEDVDIDRFTGADKATGRAALLVGRMAAHMAAGSEAGKMVVEAAEHLMGGMTLRRALLLQ